MAYQKITVWKNKSQDGGQVNTVCFAVDFPIFEINISDINLLFRECIRRNGILE